MFQNFFKYAVIFLKIKFVTIASVPRLRAPMRHGGARRFFENYFRSLIRRRGRPAGSGGGIIHFREFPEWYWKVIQSSASLTPASPPIPISHNIPFLPMAVHPIEERYGTKEMRAIWSETNRFSAVISAEVALAKAEAHHGMIPAAAAIEIDRNAHNASLERAKAIELEISHDMMAIVKAISEVCGESGRWVHYGATSNDILDTATGLQLGQTLDLIDAKLRKLLSVPPEAIRGDQAPRLHRPDPRAAGRAHHLRPPVCDLGKRSCPAYRAPRTDAPPGRGRADDRRSRDPGSTRADGNGSAGHDDGKPGYQCGGRVEPGDLPGPVRGDTSCSAQVSRPPLTRSGSRSAPSSGPRSARSRRRSGQNRWAPPPCPTSGTRSRASRSAAWPGSSAPQSSRALQNNTLWDERDLTNSSCERVLFPEASILTDHCLRLDGRGHRRARHQPRRDPAGTLPSSTGSTWPRP